MSISLKEQRKKSRRRSYANWKPPGRNNGPRNDPFRIIFYLVVIAGGIWVYFNQDTVRAQLLGGVIDGEEQAGLMAPREARGPESAGSSSSGSAEELEARAEQAYQQGQLMDAVEYYRQASELAPEHVNNYVQIARLLIYESAAASSDEERRTMLQEAMEAAETAILVDPFDPAGFAVKGKVYDWQGRPDQASSTILQAIDINKDYALAHSYLAEAYVDLNRWDQAQQSIETALSIEPDHVDIRRDYGYMFEMFGDYSSAATQYEAAIRLHPKLVSVRMALGRVYREVGKYDEALDQLFEAQTVNPSNALVAYEIGRTYETYVGDVDAALEYYQRATDLDGAFGSPWVRMASLRYFQGRYSDAIVAFERAIALDALPDGLKYQVGLAYANERRCETAVQYLDEAQVAAAEDELIMDAVQAGYEMCSQPVPDPADLAGTPTPTVEAASEG